MEYPYPAAGGMTPWNTGWHQGPAASPAGKSPWPGQQAAPWAGKQVSPWAGQQAAPWADKQAAPWGGKQVSPWGGKQAAPWGAAPSHMGIQGPYWTQQGGYPAQAMMPAPMQLDAEPAYMSELTSMLVPALNSVLPAIQGLLQIPALLMEFGESADLLSRWGDLHVMLTPGEEPNPGHQIAAAETNPTAIDQPEMAEEAPRDEAQAGGDETLEA